MALQLRVRHALGTVKVNVPTRGPEQPLIVGREMGSDVQVPSVAVEAVHCYLYVQNGLWVLRDANTKTGTYLNGQRIANAVLLNAGDVISLGEGHRAPSIEVDPAGLTKNTRPGDPGLVPRDAPPPYVAPIAAAASASAGADYDQGEAPPAEGEWPPAQESGGYRRPHRRRAVKSNSSNTMVAGVFIFLIVFVVGGVIVYQIYSANSKPQIIGGPSNASATKPVEPMKKVPTPTTVKAPAAPQGAAQRGAGAVNAVAPPQAKAPKIDEPKDNAAPDNPLAKAADAAPKAEANDPRESPEFRNVVNLCSQLGTPVPAIYAIESYRRDHPNTPLKSELDTYLDEKLDKLWLDRVEFLTKDKTDRERTVSELDHAIQGAEDPDFKKSKGKLRDKEQNELDKVNEKLAEMGYKPAASDATITADGARPDRDPAKYKDWQKEIAAKILKKRDNPF